MKKHDWTEAHAKVLSEGQCRYCASPRGLDPAHLVPRSRATAGVMDPRNIVPLCRTHHTLFDAGRLEILGSLSLDEQSFIVGLVGIEEARRRTTNGELG
jgi:predicted restriction endonuclease